MSEGVRRKLPIKQTVKAVSSSNVVRHLKSEISLSRLNRHELREFILQVIDVIKEAPLSSSHTLLSYMSRLTLSVKPQQIIDQHLKQCWSVEKWFSDQYSLTNDDIFVFVSYFVHQFQQSGILNGSVISSTIVSWALQLLSQISTKYNSYVTYSADDLLINNEINMWIKLEPTSTLLKLVSVCVSQCNVNTKDIVDQLAIEDGADEEESLNQSPNNMLHCQSPWLIAYLCDESMKNNSSESSQFSSNFLHVFLKMCLSRMIKSETEQESVKNSIDLENCDEKLVQLLVYLISTNPDVVLKTMLTFFNSNTSTSKNQSSPLVQLFILNLMSKHKHLKLFMWNNFSTFLSQFENSAEFVTNMIDVEHLCSPLELSDIVLKYLDLDVIADSNEVETFYIVFENLFTFISKEDDVNSSSLSVVKLSLNMWLHQFQNQIEVQPLSVKHRHMLCSINEKLIQKHMLQRLKTEEGNTNFIYLQNLFRDFLILITFDMKVCDGVDDCVATKFFIHALTHFKTDLEILYMVEVWSSIEPQVLTVFTNGGTTLFDTIIECCIKESACEVGKMCILIRNLIALTQLQEKEDRCAIGMIDFSHSIIDSFTLISTSIHTYVMSNFEDGDGVNEVKNNTLMVLCEMFLDLMANIDIVNSLPHSFSNEVNDIQNQNVVVKCIISIIFFLIRLSKTKRESESQSMFECLSGYVNILQELTYRKDNCWFHLLLHELTKQIFIFDMDSVQTDKSGGETLLSKNLKQTSKPLTAVTPLSATHDGMIGDVRRKTQSVSVMNACNDVSSRQRLCGSFATDVIMKILHPPPFSEEEEEERSINWEMRLKRLVSSIVDHVSPDVIYNTSSWPEQDYNVSFYQTMQRDVLISNAFQNHPILWELFEAIARLPSSLSSSPSLLCFASPLIRGLLVVEMAFWQSTIFIPHKKSVKEYDDNLKLHLRRSQRLIEMLSTADLIPHPLNNSSDHLSSFSSFQISVIFGSIWRYLKDTVVQNDSNSESNFLTSDQNKSKYRSVVRDKRLEVDGEWYGDLFRIITLRQLETENEEIHNQISRLFMN